MTLRLQKYFSRTQKTVDRALRRWLPKTSQKPSVIHKAMRYSVFAGGKRLRPLLVIAGAEACGGKAKQVLPTACALEMIHTYSLIHDDLPAMDDDDMRRGKPTSHKVFGEAIAVLAGDALLTHAFSLLSKNASIRGVSPRAAAEVIGLVASAAGTGGMIGGQVADIQSDEGRWRRRKNNPFGTPARLLSFIHQNKTAALIQASLLAGARLAGGTANQLRALASYGKNIGLAFQIMDDVLDRVGDKKKLGKKGSDQANRKLTYPALYGLGKSYRKARACVAAAHASLAPFGAKSALLHELADYLLVRDY
ncbi:MAG: polyprenyl synthetase family protein [Elusimicrobia bacterium]|nr:polyprenyl synthetase family protein [Candidatus Obscuribacterium magneticum]